MEKYEFDPNKDFEIYYETNELGQMKAVLCESGLPILESEYSDVTASNMSIYDVLLLKLNQPLTKRSKIKYSELVDKHDHLGTFLPTP